MPAVNAISPFAKQCFVTVAVCSNLIGHGCVMGFTGILLPQLQQPDTTITLSVEAGSWLASVTGINMLIGSFLISPVIGRLGRKVAHYSVSVIALVGWIVTLLSRSFEVLFFGRIVQGLSFGMMLPLRSILIGEYTSPKNRGGFLTTVSLSQGFGIFFVHLVGSFLTWQRTALVCLFFPISSLIMTVYTPESPSWLADKGRYDECRKDFRWLRGNEEEEELEEMITARKCIANNRPEFKMIETLKNKAFYKPIILMLHIYAMGQFSGATNMAAYSTITIGLIMGPGTNAKVWMIGLDTQRIVVNFLAIFIINKIKRRTMMFASGGLCISSHVAIVAYVYLRDEGVLQSCAWIPGILLTLQFFSVSIGMVPLPSVLSGEVFPLQYRSASGSISLIAVTGILFIALKTFPGLVSGVGIGGTYVVYSSLLIYCIIVVWFLMPETKDRTLQQIEDEFTGRIPNSIDENKALNNEEEKV